MATVLITGGTGFLGRHLARQLKERHRVVLTARNNKQNLEAGERTGCEVLPIDVANIESVRDVFVEVHPEIVVHAAATKFVDLAERQPMECIDVNVRGSQNVVRVSLEDEVDTVIGVSTDKASPPVRNTYGLSKALMERLFCSMDGKTSTRLACVRYGNVAWSTGSVLPIWRGMHEKEGVIGTTGPEMRRFFFTVDEAVQLVDTALSHVHEIHGRVLARRMKAALIRDILELWCRDKGGRWEQIAGRPGERNDEFIVGDLELPYTETVDFGDEQHYLISFNQLSAAPLAENVSSANVERLTDEEILQIINNPPEDL